MGRPDAKDGGRMRETGAAELETLYCTMSPEERPMAICDPEGDQETLTISLVRVKDH
jgi:hypothetical protein